MKDKQFSLIPQGPGNGGKVTWLARYRRHSKDYEKTTASAEAFTYIAMINLMSKRLAKL
jgi:transposase